MSEEPYVDERELPWAEPFATTDPERAQLAAVFAAAIRRIGSLIQLMSQAVADRIGINSTDLNCLNILSFPGQMTTGASDPAPRGSPGISLTGSAIRFLLTGLGRSS